MSVLALSRFQSIIAAVFLLMFCASECSIFAFEVDDIVVQIELEIEDSSDADETSKVNDQLIDVFFKEENSNSHFIAGLAALFSNIPKGKTSLGFCETLSDPPEYNNHPALF